MVYSLESRQNSVRYPKGNPRMVKEEQVATGLLGTKGIEREAEEWQSPGMSQIIMAHVLEKLLFESRGISDLGYLDHFLSEVECSKVASAVSYRHL